VVQGTTAAPIDAFSISRFAVDDVGRGAAADAR
jgi:hypothetical protein